MPGQIKIDDGAGNYTILTNAGSLGSDKTITLPNTTGTVALTSDSFGKVLQVVENTHSTEKLISSTSFTDSDLSASITPSAATSKILVIVQHNVQIYRISNSLTATIQLLRDATVIRDGFFQIFIGGATTVNAIRTHTIMALDTPSTTSSITYKTQGKIDTTLNSAEVKFQTNNKTDTIMLIEVDGS